LEKIIIIVGIDSVIGHVFGIAAEQAGYRIIGTSRRNSSPHTQLDVTSKLEVWPDLPECDFLVVCSSINELENCQNNPAHSYVVNVKGLEKAIDKYSSSRTKILFLSSSHVFSGNESHYVEDQEPDPQTVLGEHKVLGERMVLGRGGLVIRATKVINPQFLRFIEWAQKLKDEKPVEAFRNLMVSLVPVESLVEVMMNALRENWGGIIHVSGPKDESYYEIARILARNLFCNDKYVLAIDGRSKLIVANGRYGTLGITQRVQASSVKFPDTEAVVSLWCESYLRNIASPNK
jgi:dTDP-4-dehydrorhamnose reductase